MKRLILFIALLTLCQPFYAAFLKNVPQEFTQPDGSILTCFATGDEFYHWLHDSNGFTIIKNPQTGYFVYANLVDDELVSTNLVPGIHNPVNHGLTPNLNISSEKVAEIHRTKFQIPNLKGLKGTANTGTLNNIVIFIRFSDQSEFTASTSYYNNSFNGTSQVSMYEYFKEVSDDQLEIATQFFPSPGATVISYQDAQPRSYYEPYDATTNTNGYADDDASRIREHTLLKDATESVKSQIEATGKNFDMNGDGYVDNIAYIIQGATDGWSDLLWPHMWALYTEDVRINGLRVWDYNLQLSDAFGVSVLCHEMFHTLGAPDLYRYTNDDITPVGPWDLMANNRTPPQHMSAYMKMTYGKWFSSIPEITSAGTYTLAPLADDPFAAYIISSPNSSEFFVAEYRKAQGRFETSVPGNGLIIYRIDASLNGNADGPPDEIYVYRPDGTTSEDGSLWSAHFSAASGRTEINDATNPSSFLADGSAGGLNISNIGMAGSTISFDVSFEIVSFNSPKNLSGTTGEDFVDLEWDAPDSGNPTLSGFQVYRFGSLIATINSPSEREYRDINLSPGIYSYYVTATYTAPTGVSDPSNTVSVEVLELKPDLILENIVLDPQNTNAGTNINLTIDVRNRGIIASPATELILYLSTDNSIDAQDQLLDSFTVESLDPAAQISFDEDLLLPADLTTGDYYVIAIVDEDASIDEVDETNNEAFRIIGVRATYPDLRINRFLTNENELLPEQTVQITGSWTNIGNRTADPCDLIVAFSTDEYFDGQDIAIATYSSPELLPGEEYDFEDDYTLPPGVDPGGYFIVYWIDGNEEIPESNEANNEEYSRITILAAEDVILSNLQLGHSQIKDGEESNLSFSIQNRGYQTINTLNIDIIISLSNSLGQGDEVLSTVQLSNLDPEEERTISSDFTIPQGMSEGIYYMHIHIDPNQIPDDVNLDNNILFRQLEVLNYTDLQLSITPYKNEYKPGETAQFTVTVENLETKTSIPSNLLLLISDNNIPDSEDQIIENISVPAIEKLLPKEYIVSHSIPADHVPGLFYLIGVADNTDLVEETNEQNNFANGSFKVLDTSSDFNIGKNGKWIVYPNPAQSYISLSYKGLNIDNPNISIRNYLGQIVLKQSLNLDRIENERIDITHLTSGLYFIEIGHDGRIWNTILTVIR